MCTTNESNSYFYDINNKINSQKVESLKQEIRKVIDANPQKIEFVFKHAKGNVKEIYTTKREFGVRFLELLQTNTVELLFVKQKGCIERCISQMLVFGKAQTNVERITYLIS